MFLTFVALTSCRIFSGAVELIQKLKYEGYQIVFVTGCLDFLIAPLAKELGAGTVLFPSFMSAMI